MVKSSTVDNGGIQFALRGIALASIIILFSMLVVGCITQGAGVEKPANQSDNSTLGGGIDIKAENKTGYDITQETIALAVADGTYADNSTYAYPVGPEKKGNETVTISITVKDDVVTAASVKGNNPAPYSEGFINGVNAALPDLVVGKKITELNLPNQIAGSSLTTAVFKQYVDGLVQKS
jgi:hypothetical protein